MDKTFWSILTTNIVQIGYTSEWITPPPLRIVLISNPKRIWRYNQKKYHCYCKRTL
jgi:hypothetical protein